MISLSKEELGNYTAEDIRFLVSEIKSIQEAIFDLQEDLKIKTEILTELFNNLED